MILYIGNKLSRHGNTPTSVETLGVRLEEITEIVTVSDKKYKLFRLTEMLFSIVKYRKKVNHVLIDTYSTSNFYYALLCAALAKILGISYMPIVRGGDMPLRIKSSPKLCRFLFTNSSMNITPSMYLEEVFHQENFKTLLIPNNISIVNYPFMLRQELRPRLLYVRAFSQLYNPAMALEVLRLLRENYEDATLCMVGPDRDGTLLEVKEQCRSMGLDAYVEFPGKLEKSEWIALSSKYDIFINTTNADNTPVSLIEAMALGLPVITTNVGGIPYLVEDGIDALFVDANDAKAMSEKIRYLIENQNKATTIAENARKKAESFDWETSVKQKWVKLLNGENLVTF